MARRAVWSPSLQDVANDLKAAGDKKLTRRVAAALRKAAKPTGQAVLEEGADDLPQRGGLGDRVRAGKVGIRAGLSARTASVSITLKTVEGYDLRPINDRGRLRHPIYGHNSWVNQRVTSGRFTLALMNRAPAVRQEVTRAAQGVLDDIGRG